MLYSTAHSYRTCACDSSASTRPFPTYVLNESEIQAAPPNACTPSFITSRRSENEDDVAFSGKDEKRKFEAGVAGMSV